jgi:hypothetical protein
MEILVWSWHDGWDKLTHTLVPWRQEFRHPTRNKCIYGLVPMFKIKVFNALQTRFGPLKYTSLKTTLQNATPNCKWRRHWSPQHNPPTTRINKHRTLSLQEVELDGWFLILHTILKTCTIKSIQKFNMRFVFHFYILRLTPWIWTNPSTERLKLESPSKWN